MQKNAVKYKDQSSFFIDKIHIHVHINTSNTVSDL